MQIPRTYTAVIIVIALFIFSSGRLDAQTDRNYIYLHGQVGGTSYHGDLSEVNEDLSMFDLGFSGGFGYVVSPVFSLRTEYRRGEYPRTDRPSARGYFGRHNTGLVATINLLPNASVRPYLLGGMGMTFFGTYDKDPNFDPAFGPVIGGGFDFRLSDRFSFFTEAKWDFVLDDAAMDELTGDTGYDVLGYISGGLRMNLKSTLRPVRGLQMSGPRQAYVGDEVDFSATVDERVSAPLEYSWTFGDGRRGEGRSVVHVYMNPGTYEVSVFAINPVSQQSESMTITVDRRVVPASIAQVTVDNMNPEVDQMVRFAVETIGTDPVKVAWEFGDGTTSDRKVTQHAYREEGEYDVVVRVDNVEVAGERGVDTRRMTINVTRPEPVLPSLASLHFDMNSSYFTEDEGEVLMENVRILRDNPDLCVHVKGYADGTGTDDYNVWLSDRRAERVKDFYIANGISADRIRAEAAGIAPEPCPDGTAACRENRRVDSVVVECR